MKDRESSTKFYIGPRFVTTFEELRVGPGFGQ